MHLDPGEDDENIDAVWLFLQEFIGFTNQLLYQLPKWLVSDNHAGEEARCAGPWLANFSLGQLVQFEVACMAKFSYTSLVKASGRKINIHFIDNSSGGHSRSQLQLHSPWKISLSPVQMLFNQHHDMTHLSC